MPAGWRSIPTADSWQSCAPPASRSTISKRGGNSRIYRSPRGAAPTWDPRGNTLAVGCSDRIIHIWDVASRKPIVRLEGHSSEGISFAYNHAGDLLASTSWDGTLRLWDPRTGEQLLKTEAGVVSLRFSPDDRFLAAEVADSKLRIWEVGRSSAYCKLVGSPALGRASYFTDCAISPNGRLLASTQQTGVSFWDLARAQGTCLCRHWIHGLGSVRVLKCLVDRRADWPAALAGPEERWRDGTDCALARRQGFCPFGVMTLDPAATVG